LPGNSVYVGWNRAETSAIWRLAALVRFRSEAQQIGHESRPEQLMKNKTLWLWVLILIVAGSAIVVLWKTRSTGPDAASRAIETAAQSALSKTSGNLELTGLEQPVNVIRDTWGVPHIYAQNQHDLFFAQGFVAAQDRLFQMELWKRAGQGRLAEILGPKFLERDIDARLLQYRGDMAAEYDNYAPDTKQILEAFTQGINAYIGTRLAPGGPGLPLEFKLAGFSPESWKPEDCLTRMAGFPMTRNSVSELAHAEMVRVLGAQKASRLYNFDPPVELDPAQGVDFSDLSPSLLRNLVGSDVGIDFPPSTKTSQAADEWGSEHWGSNNWVVSGQLTETGRPILANDPHRRVDTLPSLRYIVHLVAPGWDVIGATEAGSPGVEGGHNERIGFGWTVFGMDQQDLYLETLDPSNPLRYKTESGWQTMRVERQVFHIKGQPDREVDLKFTRHGPVLWESAATHRALALRSVLAEPGTAGYLACLTMDRVTNWTEFEAAVQRWKVPTHNIVYADIFGNIGEHSVGLEPLRRNWTGLLPEPGDGHFEWGPWIPTSELPRQFNPPSGVIVTANQRMIPQGFPYKVGYEWADPDRSDRINELLRQMIASGKKFTLDDMKRIQNDVTPLPARRLVHLLEQTSGNAHDAATDLLLRWDGSATRKSAAAALYELWLINLQEAVMHRLSAGAAWDTVLRDVGSWPVGLVIRHLENPDAETFGEQPQAARDRMLHETLQAAYTTLGDLQGANPSGWSWGRLHAVVFHHPLETLPEIKPLVDLGPLPRPGDSSTVMNTEFRRGSFFQTNGPTWKEILDVGAWDNSVMINTPGQSGQPGSPHYSDLLPLWDQGEYIPMLYSREAVEKHAAQRMTLEPAK
jgi:penicillin amidase